MITWMMGVEWAGPRPRSTSTNDITTFYNIEQGIVVDIFIPTSMYCIIISTISSSGGRVAGMGPISNSPIATNSISWKSQQSTTFTLIRWGIVAVQRPIFTSPFNTNSFFPIAIVEDMMV